MFNSKLELIASKYVLDWKYYKGTARYSQGIAFITIYGSNSFRVYLWRDVIENNVKGHPLKYQLL